MSENPEPQKTEAKNTEIQNNGLANNAFKVPIQVRVMIGLCASPMLIVMTFLVYNLVLGQWNEIGVSTIIFSALGMFAYYVVATGKIPFVKRQH